MTQHVTKPQGQDETTSHHSDGDLSHTSFAGKLAHLELVPSTKPSNEAVAETRSDIQELAKGREETRQLTREEAVRRIATIGNPKSLRRFARACHDAGIVAVEFNKDGSFQASALETGENQDIADLFMAKQTEVAEARKSEEPAKAEPKAQERPKSQPRKTRPERRERREEVVTLEQIVQAAKESIPAITDRRELETKAYTLHQLDLIKKINDGRGYKVEAIEGSEDSKELVKLIIAQKRKIFEQESDQKRKQEFLADALRKIRR